MASQPFAAKTFAHSLYATFRPAYPPHLYNTILNYHHGPQRLALDVGSGHGLVARRLSQSFTNVIGTDPSEGMIAQARALSTSTNNLTFQQASSENCTFLKDGEADLVTAAECAHWFDYDQFWPEMARIVRVGGTIAIWGYRHHTLVDYPKATQKMWEIWEDKDERYLGSFWAEPAHSRLMGLLREVKPPSEEWEDVKRFEYEPGTNGVNSGTGDKFVAGRMTIGTMLEYCRTWSAYHAWRERWPARKAREPEIDEGEGDIFDEMLDEMRMVEPGFADQAVGGSLRDMEIDVEFGTGFILARRKS